MDDFILNEVQAVKLPSDGVNLDGLLYIPKDAYGLILFVHGSGSSRLSKRNQAVASVLHETGLATLLFDLLTPEEEAMDSQTSHLRFDIKLLAKRLMDASQWCLKQPILGSLTIGYFGASTGAGGALMAAAIEPNVVHAVVSRGGRPDLAEDFLESVRAPTLLIVGGEDPFVIQLNQAALNRLNCTKKMNIIPDATHLFEEPGTLNEVAQLAKHWFEEHLSIKK